MVWVGGSDESVGADQQRVFGSPEERDVLVDEVPRRLAELGVEAGAQDCVGADLIQHLLGAPLPFGQPGA